MERIYKYPLEITDFQEVDMPEGAEILCVQSHYAPYGYEKPYSECPTLWAKVDDEKPCVPRRIRIFGTGNPMEYEHELKYIGTCQMMNQKLVWHVFENYIKEQK